MLVHRRVTPALNLSVFIFPRVRLDFGPLHPESRALKIRPSRLHSCGTIYSYKVRQRSTVRVYRLKQKRTKTEIKAKPSSFV